MRAQSTIRGGARLALAALLGVLPMMSGCSVLLANAVKTQKVEQHAFAVQAQPEVIVETFNGDIVVDAAAGNEVLATVTRTGAGASQEAAEAHLNQVQVEFAQDGDTVRVIARRPKLKIGGSSGAKMELKVPPGSALRLNTSNGEIVTSGVQREVVARSSNGQIEVGGARGKLDLETSNGSIEVDATGAIVDARSSNGDVTFHGSLGQGAHSLHTSNGNIRLGLASSDSFRFAARTSNGTVKSGFSSLQTTSGKPGSNRWEASNGSGPQVQSDLKLETSNGNIKVEPLPTAEAPIAR